MRPARLVLLRRAVVDGDGGGAGGVDRPGRHAGDDPADDAPHAGHVLVALPVAELQAPRQVGVAAQRAAAAVGPVAARLAEGEAAAAAAVTRAGRVAVHVVAGAAAVRRVVRHPPAAHDGVLGAEVGAADGAAELREPRAAGAAAATAGVAALADRAVGGARPEGQVQAGADGHGAAHEGRPVDEAAPGQASLESPGRARHQRGGDAHDDRAGRGRARRRAAVSAARAERASAVSQRPTALDEEQREARPRAGGPAASPACPGTGRRRRRPPRRRPARGR